jgi:hypothetical protein
VPCQPLNFLHTTDNLKTGWVQDTKLSKILDFMIPGIAIPTSHSAIKLWANFRTDLTRFGYWLLIHWKKKDINMCISPNPCPGLGLSHISCEGGVTSTAVGGCRLPHVMANCLCRRSVHRRLLLGSHRARQPLFLQFGYISPRTCTTMRSFIAISNLLASCRGL